MAKVNTPGAGSKPARTTNRARQKLGQAVQDAAQEEAEQLRADAAGCVREWDDKLQHLEHRFEKYVREQPLKSILIAAGIGLVFGRFWKRR